MIVDPVQPVRFCIVNFCTVLQCALTDIALSNFALSNLALTKYFVRPILRSLILYGLILHAVFPLCALGVVQPVRRLVEDDLVVHGVQSPHPHPSRAARQQRPLQNDPQAGQDDHHGAAPHLADPRRRGVDQDRGPAQGPHTRRLRQEKQVSHGRWRRLKLFFIFFVFRLFARLS